MFLFKKNNVKKLTTRNFINSFWINNFWFIDDDIYFTDADLSNDKSILYKMKIEIFQQNLLDKSDMNRFFISSPNPLTSSILESSETDVQIVSEFDGFIFNLVKLNDEILLSTIVDNKGTIYNLNNNKIFNKNIVILGEMNDKLLIKTISSRKTFLVNTNLNLKTKQVFDYDVIKIINVQNKKILLTSDNQIIFNNKIIYKSNNELMISNFDKTAFLVSDKKTKDLFYLTGKNFEQKEIIESNRNYYYRMDCFSKQLIIAKPLYDDINQVNYHLPLKIIY